MTRYPLLQSLALGLALAGAAEPSAAQNPRSFADLGSCPATAGGVVLECRLGYITYGRLNEARDNAVLIPSWYGGTSQSLHRLLKASFVDTTRFHVILVDVIGNGVSTSPSNSRAQPGAAFPQISIADMVEAQRRLLREHLGITRLHAIVGFSMGAFQALEWAVRFPDDVAHVVALHGSAQPSAHDLSTWRTMRWLIRLSEGELPPDSANVPLIDMWNVVRATPARINEMDADSVAAVAYRTAAGWGDFAPEDNRLQLNAIIGHDITSSFGGSLERAADAVKARLLIVVAEDDRIVGPESARRFATLTGARLMEVRSPCGHFALFCDERVAAEVRAFLAPAAASVHSTGARR